MEKYSMHMFLKYQSFIYLVLCLFCLYHISGEEIPKINIEQFIELQKSEKFISNDFIVRQWDELENTFLFLFKNKILYQKYTKRINFYLEKKSYANIIWSNKILKNKRGWNASNWDTQKISFFFNLAGQYLLNSQEKKIISFLLDKGIISKNNQKYSAEKSILLLFSADSKLITLKLLLNHELSHAFYTLNTRYQKKINHLFSFISKIEKDFWLKYWENYMKYNIQDKNLLKNEWQAYLLQIEPMDLPTQSALYYQRIYSQDKEKIPHSLIENIMNSQTQVINAFIEMNGISPFNFLKYAQ